MVVLLQSGGMPGLVPAMAEHRIQRETLIRTSSPKLPAYKGAQRKELRARRQGEPHGLNVDERLRLVRERREQRERELVTRELGWLEREERARRFHEKQLDERRKRLLEQRKKEDKRRHAVEEKRRIRLKEEKERCERAVQQTQERSQRANQRLMLASRGRKLRKNSVPCRLPLSPWEKSLVSRLLTPTCAFLARSKSTGCQSLDGVSCHSMNANNTCKAQQHGGPADHRTSTSPSPARTSQRTSTFPSTARTSQRTSTSPSPARTNHRTSTSPSPARTNHRTSTSPSPATTNHRTSTSSSPATTNHRTSTSPSPARTSHRTINLLQVGSGQTQNSDRMWTGGTPQTAGANRLRPGTDTQNAARSPSRSVIRHMTPKQMELPTVLEEEVAVDSESLSSRGLPTMTTPAVFSHDPLEDRAAVNHRPTSLERPTVTSFRSEGLENHLVGAVIRPAAGTTDPEEALRLLSEKRREARQRREREEEERLRREEIERKGREEMERWQAEEQAQLQAKAQRLEEERKRREEEERKQAEAEEARKALEEAVLLQKQREEEQARQQQRAEQQRLERETVFKQEEEERQARKKRLDEIMKRTRRPAPSDRKPALSENIVKEVQPKENTEPVLNGTIEVMKLPLEDIVPVVAFKERRSLRPLSSLEEIQTHQRAEII